MARSIERRAAAELRANGRRLEGYAAVFGQPAQIGGFTETIATGAFGKSLAGPADVLALRDHDRTRVLGRTRSGSLRLSEDGRGLAFQLDLPETGDGRDLLALAERNDLGGASFGFRAVDEHWHGQRRELRAVELVEISIVSAWPAYPGTSVVARSLPPGPGRRSLAQLRLYVRTL